MMKTTYSKEQQGELGALCQAEWARLVGALSLYVGDVGVAEELAQEAIARLCADWAKVSQMASPAGWLHRVGQNLANDRFRRLVAERRARGRLKEPASESDWDRSDALMLRQAVSRLPRRQKTALVLRYFLDLSVEETALLMDSPENTVKSLCRRALATLQGNVAESPEEAV